MVGKDLENKELIEQALSSFHSKKISIITKPTKKDRGLLEICKTNTEFILKKDKPDSGIDFKIDALKKELKIETEIETIESYDISHHSGDNAVAGCVVFTNAGKAKNLYRTYNMSKENSGNDIGSMIELINRRFASDKRNKIPSLIIIDGGRTHLNAVIKRMKEFEIPKTNIISISKGVRRKSSFDSIHLEKGESMIVKEGSVFHHFIQEIRDETHRFAISALKKKRAKSSIESTLDSLVGVGPKRKKHLLRYFGSFEQLKRASINDIAEVAGIGLDTAKSIYHQIH